MPILDSPAGTAVGSNDPKNPGTYKCVVRLPADADVKGVRCFARESGNNAFYECIGGGNGHDCGGFQGSTNPLGYASFFGTYTVEAPGNAVIVSWTFSN